MKFVETFAESSLLSGGLEKDQGSGMSNDLDFDDQDFHDSVEFDISDIKITALRNKNLSRIDVVLKSDSGQSIDIMRWYLALKAYVFKIETEIGIMDEAPEIQ